MSSCHSVLFQSEAVASKLPRDLSGLWTSASGNLHTILLNPDDEFDVQCDGKKWSTFAVDSTGSILLYYVDNLKESYHARLSGPLIIWDDGDVWTRVSETL